MAAELSRPNVRCEPWTGTMSSYVNGVMWIITVKLIYEIRAQCKLALSQENV